MPQISIAPTRTNLIRLKKELRFAKEVYEILDRKREALTGELVRVAKEADALQKEVWALLAVAYEAMEKARLVMGSDHVEWAALAVNKTVEVNLRLRGIQAYAGHASHVVGFGRNIRLSRCRADRSRGVGA
jgi:V/A-type H+-transporting ATPase subunit D